MTVKVGDKIRVIDADPNDTHYVNGDIFYVSKVWPDGAGVDVGNYDEDAGLIELYTREFEVVTRNPHAEIFAEPLGKEVGAPQTQADRIEAICNEVRALLIRKNHDYGDSFSKQFAKYGVLSGLIRMDDKMARLDTLINGGQAQVAESVEDSIADLAGYALLTLVELRKTSEVSADE